MKLTQKIARKYLGMIDCQMKRNIEFDEYVLHHDGSTYFTSDLQDVVDTARYIRKNHPNIGQAEAFLQGF
jgi:hypothetical protein